MTEAEGGASAGSRAALRVGVTLLFLAVALVALAVVREVLLVGFMGVLIGAVLTYPIDLFSRWMPRGVAVLLTLVLLAGVLAGVGVLAVPFIASQVRDLVEKLPQAVARLHEFWRFDVSRHLHAPPGSPPAGADGAPDLAKQLGQSSAEAVGKLATHVLPVAMSTVSVVVGLVLVLALAFFLAHETDSYRHGLRKIVPVDREPVLDEAWRRVGRALRHWMGGILISMTIMGTLAAIGLWIAGVDGWPTLALLTFLGTFVPYAGAIASAVPGLAVALADSPTRFVYAMGVYLMVHLVEGYIVQPLIMKHAVSLRPATLLFWQLVMATLFGALGVIAATPLLACVVVAVDYLWVERALGKPV